MSALLQGPPPRDAAGEILADNSQVSAPDHYNNGIPYDANGHVSFDSLGAHDHYHQGLSFTVLGRIRMLNVAVTHYGSGAAPFDDADFLVVVPPTPIDHYSGGVGYAPDGKVCIS